jgi:hypothetical protein
MGSSVDARLDAPLARALAEGPSYTRVSELAEALAEALGLPPAPATSLDSPPLEAFFPLAPPLEAPPPLAPPLEAPPPLAPPVSSTVLQAPPRAAVPPNEMAFAAVEPATSVVASPLDVPSGDPSMARSRRLFLQVGAAITVAVAVMVVAAWAISSRGGGHVAATSSASSKAPMDQAPSSVEGPGSPAPNTSAIVAPTPVTTGASPDPDTRGGAETRDGQTQLVVSCTPACDVVTVDGLARASFPTTVTPGKHTITASRGRHALQTKQVEVAPGKEQTVSFVFFSTQPTPVKKPCGKFLQRCD